MRTGGDFGDVKFRSHLHKAALLLLVIAGTVVIWGDWRIRHAPLPASLELAPPATRVLEDLRGRPFSLPAGADARDARFARLNDLGPWLPLATVAIEDRRFFEHDGVDFYSVASATLRNFTNGRIISGASTITQQTVKLGTGRTRRTFDAKWREAFAALRLDREWTKTRILENYLNRLDYGNRRIGPVAAAFAYFGKAPADLTFAEAVYLAGIPQSPSRLNPWRNSGQTLARYERNVRRMAKQNLLPPGIAAETLLASPPQPGAFELPSDAPHFAREALSRLRPGDNARRTTLDLDLQQDLQRLLSEARKSLDPLGASACGLVVLDNETGGVRAMVSSSLPQHRDINLATMPRSAGSTLKPFLYLEAIDQRLLSAADWVPDTEEAIRGTYADYDPQNYNHRFLGPVRVREALANSLNVPAVVTLARVGARNMFASLGGWGFRFPKTFDDYGAGFILGNAEVTLLDLASAYASLARRGEQWRAPLIIGEPVEPSTSASAAACDIITDILCDNNARRVSFGDSSPLNVGIRVAVKTGTSSGFRDGWCVGFTQNHTVAVWAGNPDGSPMDSALAVRSAAPIWNAAIRLLLARGDQPLPAPTPSETLVALDVSRATGLVPQPGEPSLTEWFLPGTVPTVSSATRFQPAPSRALLLPAEYAAWCGSPQNRLGAVAENDSFKILFPKNGAVFVFNPDLPPDQQVLIFSSSEPACDWFANGQKLDSARLALRPGTWTLTARSGSREQSATFRVE